MKNLQVTVLAVTPQGRVTVGTAFCPRRDADFCVRDDDHGERQRCGNLRRVAGPVVVCTYKGEDQ